MTTRASARSAPSFWALDRMTEPVLIQIRPASDADASLWRLTREIAAILHPLPWVLVGGQMVAILEAEHGAAIGFVNTASAQSSRVYRRPGSPPTPRS